MKVRNGNEEESEKLTWNSERRRSWREERAEGWVWGNWHSHRRRRRWGKKACFGGIGISATADAFQECSPTFPPFRQICSAKFINIELKLNYISGTKRIINTH